MDVLREARMGAQECHKGCEAETVICDTVNQGQKSGYV